MMKNKEGDKKYARITDLLNHESDEALQEHLT